MQRQYIYNSLRSLALVLGLCLLCLIGKSQATQPFLPPPPGSNQIIIDSTDVFYFAAFGPDSVKIRKLLGNVILRQDTTVLYCDSAYQYIDSNFVEAFSHVRIVMNDHMPDSMRRTISADKLTFDGNTKVINFWNDVVLTDKNIVLKTPRLTYYRIQDYAEYLLTGVITSKENVLFSQKGYYYPKSSMAYFKEKVKLVNPDFTLVTDTLGYNTESKVAFFLAPTWVNDSTSSMYTEEGFYDTERDYVLLHDNCSIGDTTYTLYADTIQYDQGRDLGKAQGHVRLEQIDSSLTVFGNYGEFRSKTQATFVTDSAFAIQRLDHDTLFLFADTLSTYKDTVDQKRFFMAYKHSSFLTKEMQGICDSLVYWYDDSLMFFYQQPALWSDRSQITGDTILIKMQDGTVDSMSIPSNPFIVTEEDTVGYDQIKGKRLHAKFKDKRLSKMWIFGNSESIYYTKDDKENYMGMNKARCSDMLIDFKDNRPSRILFKEKPEGEFFPIHLVLYKENVLDGFVWRASERPKRPAWVDAVINRQAMLHDPLRLRMDTLLTSLKAFEFELRDLMASDVFKSPSAAATPGSDSLPQVPEGGVIDTLGSDTAAVAIQPIDTMAHDTLAHDTAVAPIGKGAITGTDPVKPTGKGKTKAKKGLSYRDLLKSTPAIRKLTKEERLTMNFKQEHVFRKKRHRAKKELHAQVKASKNRVKFKDRWKAFKKDLKTPPTKAELAAREKAKMDARKARIDRRAKRMDGRHQREIVKKNLKKLDPGTPKDNEFNDVELRKHH
jgi:lipopolysaccharide export system protein LptA